MSRAEQAANAIKDAMDAYRIAGVLPSPEEIKSLAITFLIEENKFGRLPQKAEVQQQATQPITAQITAMAQQEQRPQPVTQKQELPQEEIRKPSPAQVKFLFSLASKTGFIIKDWLKSLNVSSPFELEPRTISQQIDRLKKAA